MLFFGVAAVIATAIIYGYTRCVRSTALVIACSLIAVVWQLGLVALLGFELDPYSILVPFLVFAIGVSHGAQKMNGIMQDIGRGTHKLVAARYTFRRLFLAGLTALLADAVGFAVLMVIDIPVIQDLAITASIGVAVLIFTNLLLLPVLLSYTGVSKRAARAQPEGGARGNPRQGPRQAVAVPRPLHHPPLGDRRHCGVGAAGGGRLRGQHEAEIGDLDPGAPELRADSRYNRDTAYITGNYALSCDQFAVIVKTDARRLPELRDAGRGRPPGLGAAPGAGRADHRVAGRLGAPDHRRLVRGQSQVADAEPQPGRAQLRRPADLGQQPGPVQPRLLGDAGDRLPGDHKAETLDRVVAHAEEFARQHNDEGRVVPARRRHRRHRGGDQHRGAQGQIADAAVRVCGGDRAVLHHLPQLARRVVAVVPLVITSILCEALMVGWAWASRSPRCR